MRIRIHEKTRSVVMKKYNQRTLQIRIRSDQYMAKFFPLSLLHFIFAKIPINMMRPDPLQRVADPLQRVADPLKHVADPLQCVADPF